MPETEAVVEDMDDAEVETQRQRIKQEGGQA